MAKTNPHGMTDQMFLFCQGYIRREFKDATGAYLKAYPRCSEKAAPSAASRMLKNVKAATYLAEVQAKASKKAQLTVDQVVGELVKIGFSDMQQFAEWGPSGVTLKDSTEMEPDATACVAEVSETIGEKSISLRFKLHDKVAALRDLGRHLGMFKDTMEHTIKHDLDLSKLSDKELERLYAAIKKATVSA